MSLPVNSLPIAPAASPSRGNTSGSRSSGPGFDSAMQDALQQGSAYSAKPSKHDAAASAGGRKPAGGATGQAGSAAAGAGAGSTQAGSGAAQSGAGDTATASPSAAPSDDAQGSLMGPRLRDRTSDSRPRGRWRDVENYISS